jgi:hypothetical protein
MKSDNAASEPTGLIPTWEGFNADFLAPAVPVYCVVRQNPLIRLFVSANAERIGCTFALSDKDYAPMSLLKEVAVRELEIEGSRVVEISTGTPSLFRHFYALLECVCESVVRDSATPQNALSRALRDWQTLLKSSLLLTEERQAGLYGELWMLNRLIQAFGPKAAVDAWIGPLGQTHDFRIGESEFEVKTTTWEQRRHHINGLNQLRPSPNKLLYLLSIHLTPAGAIGGETLAELALRAQHRFGDDSSSRDKFESLLDVNLGFRKSDYGHYVRRWQMRSAPTLVPVLYGCPRLVPDALTSLPDDYATNRIIDVTYQINLDGLGFEDGSPSFLALLPTEAAEGVF